ncbi:putative F-box/LRR-repeat protein at3g59160 [Phtheirospermum japonicum]|uniref:Putative F-box/LRR-repeat protein at3g59160 n=1 Tax=Phtheirospermum japonicum TaxID=374723 RepID=A0A830D9C5_9LAMI|nr:putative F-box/LRR-repeat protein at3g59160 [Phtheirospermum japonicum]
MQLTGCQMRCSFQLLHCYRSKKQRGPVFLHEDGVIFGYSIGFWILMVRKRCVV